MNTPNGRQQVEELFGNPALTNGLVNMVWEHTNIISAVPPPGWQLFYQNDNGTLHQLSPRIHRLLQDSFTAVLTDIWNFARIEVKKAVGDGKTTPEYDDLTRAWLHERRLDQHNGGYNFRPVTGGSGLSMHAYGIAIDWDAAHNPRRNPMQCTLPDWWYGIWADHGWANGKHFPTADPMHVQFATGV